LLGGFGEVHAHDVVAAEGDHFAPLAVLDGLSGPQTVAGGEDAVVGRWCATALEVPQHHVACLDAGALFDLTGQPFRYPSQPDVAELVFLGSLGHEVLAESNALRDSYQAPLLAFLGAFFEDPGDLVQVRFDFRDERHVGGGGEACAPGDPTGVPPHHLDHDDPLVAPCRGPEPVYGVRGDGDGRVVAEGRVRRREVVVYGLGASHDLHPEVVVEPLGDAKRIVTAYGDEGVNSELL